MTLGVLGAAGGFPGVLAPEPNQPIAPLRVSELQLDQAAAGEGTDLGGARGPQGHLLRARPPPGPPSTGPPIFSPSGEPLPLLALGGQTGLQAASVPVQTLLPQDAPAPPSPSPADDSGFSLPFGLGGGGPSGGPEPSGVPPPGGPGPPTPPPPVTPPTPPPPPGPEPGGPPGPGPGPSNPPPVGPPGGPEPFNPVIPGNPGGPGGPGGGDGGGGPPVTPLPDPFTWMLLVLGFGLTGLAARFRRRRQA